MAEKPIVKKRRSSLRRDKFLEVLPYSKSGKEAAIKAGYPEGSAAQVASRLINDPLLQAKLARLGEKSLDRLEKMMDESANDIAVSSAAKTLIETSYGKPKSNDEKHTPLPPITIVFNKTPEQVKD